MGIYKLMLERTLDTILRQQDPQSILGIIQNKVLELKKIDQIWQQTVPAELSKHSRVANFRDGCLVIEIDSAAWAMRLRYLLSDLITELSVYVALQRLKQIEWYIQPHYYHSPLKQTRQLPILSDDSARLLKHTAASIKTKRLQEALIKLSNQ